MGVLQLLPVDGLHLGTVNAELQRSVDHSSTGRTLVAWLRLRDSQDFSIGSPPNRWIALVSTKSSAVIPVWAVCTALAIHSLWGGNPVAVKLGLEAFPPLWSGFFRFILGCMCVYAWARFTGVELLPPRDEWLPLLAIGSVFTVQIALMNFGISQTTATHGAVLISTNPLFGVLFAHWLVPGDRAGWLRVLGAVIAFAGVALVLLLGSMPHDSADSSVVDRTILDSSWLVVPRANSGDWIVLTSACLLGLRLGLSGRLLQRGNEVRLTFWQMLLSLPAFGLGAWLTETIRWEAIGMRSVAGIGYQGIVVAGLAFTVNFYLMKRFSPSVMISFNFVAPVAGVLLGMAILGEEPTLGLLAGMLLVACGLVLIARRVGL